MNQPSTPQARLRLDVHLDGSELTASLADDVRRGLTAHQKELPPKYFYDDAGSDLFERITELPEYYPTRAERALLARIADGLMADLRPVDLVELGSGSSTKTRLLLGSKSAPEHLRRYVAFDVSEGIVRATAEELLRDYPFLRVHGVIGDFERHLDKIPPIPGVRLVLFLGGTIGNLDRAQRVAFLSNVATLLDDDDRLLIGMDLVKDVPTIEAAYDDSAGITAEFNRNVLRVVNRVLGADFAPDAFAHRSFFNREASRIEMHLVAQRSQQVHIKDLELTVHFAEGETIWTESSYKFTKESITDSLTASGLRLDRWFEHDDPMQLFGLALAAKA